MSIAAADVSHAPVWFRSSYSNGAGGECVECALAANDAFVRDSKCETGPVITLSSGAWRAFLGGVLEHGRLAQ
ncbi:DUF397 domain-containing protein [Streptomyces sp. DT2A-34]|nr:DUF397 domain-containing protein [Streptomyces sp. DT2A-34]MDO0914658.1 DUF397 domain-containing protein [Streptomyces sp. DT2A-34]